MQTRTQRPNWALPLHIPGCVKSSCRTPAAVSTASRVEPIPRFQRMVVARRAAGEGRELGAQLPANTRAHSISPRPSDATSHCPASVQKHKHTSPPCHLPYSPHFRSSAVLCSPGRVMGHRRCCLLMPQAAGFYLLHNWHTHTHTHTHTHSRTPLLVDSVTARGV